MIFLDGRWSSDCIRALLSASMKLRLSNPIYYIIVARLALRICNADVIHFLFKINKAGRFSVTFADICLFVIQIKLDIWTMA